MEVSLTPAQRSTVWFFLVVIRVLEWPRLPGDIVFIVGGILPLLYLALRMVANRKRPGTIAANEPTERLTT